MSDAHEHDQPDGPGPSGNLAPVALGLGIAGLLLGLIPFYGLFFALPLSVVALVLGLTARGRPDESRGQAMGGAVTGGMGLVLVVAWAGWIAWGQLGFGSFASETAVEVGAEEMTLPTDLAVGPSSSPDASPDDPPRVEVAPGNPDHGLVTGLSGDAEVAIDEETHMLTLAECALSEQTSGGVLVRGDGPEGRLVVAQTNDGLLLDVEIDGGPQRTLAGDVRGISGRGGGGGLLRDRRQFELDGELRDLHSDEIADVSLTVTCS